jgi:hypothetical protein
LQPVVLEYTSDRLVETLAQEVLAGQPGLLVSPAVAAMSADPAAFYLAGGTT